MKNKRAQLAIFVIIALVIIAAIVSVFVFREELFGVDIPQELMPVYEYYQSCIEADVRNGVKLMGAQAGYLQKPEFDPGSNYMPFSNQLDFLGLGVPYWYYVSGNNLQKEQVPSRSYMEDQLEEYLKETVIECDFDAFRDAGFQIDVAEVENAGVTIKDNEVSVSIGQNLNITKGESQVLIRNHKADINSRIGNFYEIAKKIYDHEKDNLFLETYGVDILRLYAPVDGMEISCSPQIWYLEDIRSDLQNAIRANTGFIKVKGNYYSLAKDENKYFVQDIGENIGSGGEFVNFINLEDFPFKMEVEPREGVFLMAEPLGTQPGLGALGFCVAPYHFVYDLAYPVLIQVSDGEELFQFPYAVVIDKNVPVEGKATIDYPDLVPAMCEDNKLLTTMEVYTYDSSLRPVEANIKFKCFSTICDIGRTESDGIDALLTTQFPQCANASIIAEAPGYSTKSYRVSTINPGTADIILDKIHELNLEVVIDGRAFGNSQAIVNFESSDNSAGVVYPEQKKVSLSSGQYKISATVYQDARIQLESTSTRKCVDVPRQGIGGIFGLTEEQCFDFEIPEQIASYALTAGGSTSYFIAEEELRGSSRIRIIAEDIGVPTSADTLQSNYEALEDKTLFIQFS